MRKVVTGKIERKLLLTHVQFEKVNSNLNICFVLFRALGVRYNAEKKKVGNYYTTPIYRFRMKCHLCDNHFEIETDPKVSLTQWTQCSDQHVISPYNINS